MAGDTVSDVLETRLDMVGLGEYLGGWGRIAGAAGAAELKLNSATKASLAWSAGLGAFSAGSLAFFVESAKEAGEEAADFNRAVGNFKGKFPLEEMREFTAGLSDLTGIEDQAIVQSLGLLGTFQLTTAQAKQLELPILNAAESLRAMGVSSEGLANAVGKAIESGNVKGLKLMGVVIHDTAFASKSLAERVNEVADALQHQGGDAAIAFSKTLPGTFRRLSTDVKEFREDLGEALIGPLQGAVGAVDGLVHSLRALPGPAKTAIATTGVALAGAAGVASLALLGLTVQTGFLAREELLAAKAAREEAAALGEVAVAATAAAGAKGAAAAAGGGGTVAAVARAAKGGRLGGLLKGAAIVAGLEGAREATQLAPDGGLGGKLKKLGGNVLGGAEIGGAIGSIIPGVGTVLGAGIGGVGGLAKNAIEDTFGGGAHGGATKTPEASAAEKTLEELRKQTDLLKELATGKVLDTKGDVAGSMVQAAAMARARALQH